MNVDIAKLASEESQLFAVEGQDMNTTRGDVVGQQKSNSFGSCRCLSWVAYSVSVLLLLTCTFKNDNGSA
jgi:hypothetical protein